jgi:hypothetical protein
LLVLKKIICDMVQFVLMNKGKGIFFERPEGRKTIGACGYSQFQGKGISQKMFGCLPE